MFLVFNAFSHFRPITYRLKLFHKTNSWTYSSPRDGAADVRLVAQVLVGDVVLRADEHARGTVAATYKVTKCLGPV
jgi:hypothetical protein